MQEKAYLLSNKLIILNRNVDATFKNKWQGIWDSDFKLVDFYEYEIMQTKLKGGKVLYNGWKAIHEYAIKGLTVTEQVFPAQQKKVVISRIIIKNNDSEEKVIKIKLKIGVNHRHLTTNYHETQYETIFEEHKKYVMIKSINGITLFGTTNKNATFESNPIKVEYYSGNEKQACMTQGGYCTEIKLKPNEEKEVPFLLGISKIGLGDVLTDFLDAYNTIKKEENAKEKEYNKLEKRYDIECWAAVKNLLKWCNINIELLTHDDKLYAGLPWFTQYWGRDTFWSFNALLHTDRYELARNVLITFLEKQERNGLIPRLIKIDGEAESGGVDSTLLLIIALNEYTKYTGDTTLITDYRENIAKLFKWIEQNTPNNEITDDGTHTWMDTLKRERAVEIQSLLAQALDALSDIYLQFDDKLSEKLDIKRNLALKKLGEYWNRTYFNDTKEDDKITPNQLVLAVFSHIKKEQFESIRKTITNSLVTRNGVRTLSGKDKNYSPTKYHEGMIWGLTNVWYIISLLNYGHSTEAVDLLKNISKNTGKKTIGCIPECYNGDTGEELGSSCQLWSSSLLIKTFDEHLLGIKPNLIMKYILLEPIIPMKIERHNKRIGDFYLDIIIEGAKIQLLLSKKMDIIIKIKPKETDIKGILVNGKLIDGDSFIPETENEIELITD